MLSGLAAVNFARKDRQRWRPQLSGHLQCGGLPADIDAGDEQHRRIALHDAFVGKGMRGKRAPQPAVMAKGFLVPLVLSTRLIVRLLG
jgi:hypothetical protein